MPKLLRIVSGVLIGFLLITFLHVWQNIGFDQLGLEGGKAERFQVGFLPVT